MGSAPTVEQVARATIFCSGSCIWLDSSTTDSTDWLVMARYCYRPTSIIICSRGRTRSYLISRGGASRRVDLWKKEVSVQCLSRIRSGNMPLPALMAVKRWIQGHSNIRTDKLLSSISFKGAAFSFARPSWPISLGNGENRSHDDSPERLLSSPFHRNMFLSAISWHILKTIHRTSNSTYKSVGSWDDCHGPHSTKEIFRPIRWEPGGDWALRVKCFMRYAHGFMGPECQLWSTFGTYISFYDLQGMLLTLEAESYYVKGSLKNSYCFFSCWWLGGQSELILKEWLRMKERTTYQAEKQDLFRHVANYITAEERHVYRCRWRLIKSGSQRPRIADILHIK